MTDYQAGTQRNEGGCGSERWLHNLNTFYLQVTSRLKACCFPFESIKVNVSVLE